MGSLKEKAIRDLVRKNFRLEGGGKLTSSHLKELGQQLSGHGKLGRSYLHNARAALGGVANPASRTQTEGFMVGLHEATNREEITVGGKKLEAKPNVTKTGLRSQVKTVASPPAVQADTSQLQRQKQMRSQMIQRVLAQARPPQQTPNAATLVAGRTGGALPLTSISRLDRGGQKRASEPTVAPTASPALSSEPSAPAATPPTPAAPITPGGPSTELASAQPTDADTPAVPSQPEAPAPTDDELPTEKPDDLEIG